MSDRDFLSRWSRRKRRRDVETEEANVADPSFGPAAEAVEPETQEEETALLAELELPVPESLQPGDDFSAFMADHVPEFLRKRALRVLWKSNPVLANLDGLNDYDDDFTSPELTQKVLSTAYQVGRGIVSKIPEPLQEDEPEESPEQPSEPEEIAVVLSENQTPRDVAPQDDDVSSLPRPRRMKFDA